MEETKYYTPTIEEFHVGFELELKLHELKNWEKHTWLPGDQASSVAKYLEQTRVKYLDQEDMESFGFKLWTYKGNELGFMLNPDEDGSTWIHRIEGKIKISTTFPDITLYLGKIKNKSELKRLLKQLEII